MKPIDAVPAPRLVTAEIFEGDRIMDLDRLIEMKLVAFRLKDRVHLLEMIDAGLIDATTLKRLPEPLRPRLAEMLANSGG